MRHNCRFYDYVYRDWDSLKSHSTTNVKTSTCTCKIALAQSLGSSKLTSVAVRYLLSYGNCLSVDAQTLRQFEMIAFNCSSVISPSEGVIRCNPHPRTNLAMPMLKLEINMTQATEQWTQMQKRAVPAINKGSSIMSYVTREGSLILSILRGHMASYGV